MLKVVSRFRAKTEQRYRARNFPAAIDLSPWLSGSNQCIAVRFRALTNSSFGRFVRIGRLAIYGAEQPSIGIQTTQRSNGYSSKLTNKLLDRKTDRYRLVLNYPDPPTLNYKARPVRALSHLQVRIRTIPPPTVLGNFPQPASNSMNWFKMLPNASLRAPLQPGRWFTKGIRREPETMEPRHEKRQPKPA